MNHFGLSQNGEDKTWGLILSQMSLVLSLEGGKMELISILNINNVAKSKILSGRQKQFFNGSMNAATKNQGTLLRGPDG